MQSSNQTYFSNKALQIFKKRHNTVSNGRN